MGRWSSGQLQHVLLPAAATWDNDLLPNTILKPVEGYLQEATERAAISLLEEGPKWVADRERSRVERELV